MRYRVTSPSQPFKILPNITEEVVVVVIVVDVVVVTIV